MDTENQGLRIEEVAELFGVALNTVQNWRARGLPAQKQQTFPCRLLFDKQAVEEWLAAHGIVPGTKGRRPTQDRLRPAGEGQVGKRGARPRVVGTPGLEACLRRLASLELRMSQDLEDALDENKGISFTQGLIRNYELVVEGLRKATAGVLDLQIKRGDVVRRDDLLDTVAHLCAFLRSRVERFPDDMRPRLVAALGQRGIAIADLADFQRALQEEAQKLVDDWLANLSANVARVPDSIGKGYGSPERQETVESGGDNPEPAGEIEAESVGRTVSDAEGGDDGPAGGVAE